MVKPSNNQKFKIDGVEILKHKNPSSEEGNFKFKPLIEYDKNISQLVFDIEVDVNLILHVSEKLSKEEKKLDQNSSKISNNSGVFNKIKRGATSIIINGGNN